MRAEGEITVLVMANGAPKSGSTWMFNILSEMHNFAKPPPEFILDTKNVNPEIRYDRLADLLSKLNYRDEDYLIKNHFGEVKHRELVLSFDSVFVFDIERDIRDVVVSGYFYEMRRRSPEERESFQRYYWTEGRYLADLVRNYHNVWREAPRDRAFLVSYNRLKTDFSAEVLRMGQFLGLSLSDEQLRVIGDATSMNSLRKKYDDDGDIKFFRKGAIGDWVNHFRGPEMNDIKAIDARGIHGLGFLQKNYGRIKKRLPEIRLPTGKAIG